MIFCFKKWFYSRYGVALFLLIAVKDEQLWCFDGKTLTNKKGVWTSLSEWTLPDSGNVGLVKDEGTDHVLGVESTGKVTLQKEIEHNIKQQWFRSKDFENRCFQLSNDAKYLTAIDDDKTPSKY